MIQLSLDQLRELLGKTGGNPPSFFQVGKSYLIRTVTHYYTGSVFMVTDAEVILTDAAWIADTGRFSDSLANGSLSEVEPYKNPVMLSRGAIVDATEWNHPLPRSQK